MVGYRQGFVPKIQKKSENVENYTFECFSEAGSARIRSAVKFCVDLDGQIFSNFSENFKKFPKNIFGSIFFGKVGKFSNIKIDSKFHCGSNPRTPSL